MWNGFGVEEDNGEDTDDCEGDVWLRGSLGIRFHDQDWVHVEQCKEQGEIRGRRRIL